MLLLNFDASFNHMSASLVIIARDYTGNVLGTRGKLLSSDSVETASARVLSVVVGLVDAIGIKHCIIEDDCKNIIDKQSNQI